MPYQIPDSRRLHGRGGLNCFTFSMKKKGLNCYAGQEFSFLGYSMQMETLDYPPGLFAGKK